MLSDADSIVFLGFGFHAVNLERLDVKSHCQKSAVVYVSTLGVTDSEVQYHLRDLSSGPYAFEHKGNLAFIRDHLDIFY